MPKPSIIDREDVLSVLFHPGRAARNVADTSQSKSVRIPVAESIALGGRIHLAEHQAPLVLFFHGNGEVATDYDDLAPIFLRLGLSLLVVDYRGYGDSDGLPTSSSLLDDAMTVYRLLPEIVAEHHISPERIFIMGRSLGSAAAIEIACRTSEIAGLILDSGFAYTFPLIERLGGPPLNADEDSDGFGNLAKIARVTVPTLIIHGERDRIIPVGDARAVYDQSGASQKKLMTVPGAGHNDLLAVDPRGYFRAVEDFVSPQ